MDRRRRLQLLAFLIHFVLVTSQPLLASEHVDLWDTHARLATVASQGTAISEQPYVRAYGNILFLPRTLSADELLSELDAQHAAAVVESCLAQRWPAARITTLSVLFTNLTFTRDQRTPSMIDVPLVNATDSELSAFVAIGPEGTSDEADDGSDSANSNSAVSSSKPPDLGSNYIFVLRVDDGPLELPALFARVVVAKGFKGDFHASSFTFSSEDPLSLRKNAAAAAAAVVATAPSASSSEQRMNSGTTWERSLRVVSLNIWNTNPPRWVWRHPPNRLRQYALRLLQAGEVLRRTERGMFNLTHPLPDTHHVDIAEEVNTSTPVSEVEVDSSRQPQQRTRRCSCCTPSSALSKDLPDIIAFQEVRYDTTLGGWDGGKPPLPVQRQQQQEAAASEAADKSGALPADCDPGSDDDTSRSTGDGDDGSGGVGRRRCVSPSLSSSPSPTPAPPGSFAEGMATALDWYGQIMAYGATELHGTRNSRKWKGITNGAEFTTASLSHPEATLDVREPQLESRCGRRVSGSGISDKSTQAAAAAAAEDGAPIAATQQQPAIADALSGQQQPPPQQPRSPYAARSASPALDPESVISAVRRSPHAQISHLSALLPEFQYVSAVGQLYIDPESYWREPTRDEEGPAIFSRHPIVASDYYLLSRNVSDEGDGHQRVVLHAVIDVTDAVQQQQRRKCCCSCEGDDGDASDSSGDDASHDEEEDGTSTSDSDEEGAADSTCTSSNSSYAPPQQQRRRRYVDVYSVHLALSESARNRTIPEIQAYIASSAVGELSILAGDMNAEPHEPAMQTLVRGSATAPFGDEQEQQKLKLEGEGDQQQQQTCRSGGACASADDAADGDSGGVPTSDRDCSINSSSSGRSTSGSSSGRGAFPMFDTWSAVHAMEPAPGSLDPSVQRYGLTFPSDAPTKRIDLLLANTPDGRSLCARGGGGGGALPVRKTTGTSGEASDGASESAHADGDSTSSDASCICVSRAFLIGQDALPATEGYEGRGVGMMSERSPIYASDHRAVVVDIALK